MNNSTFRKNFNLNLVDAYDLYVRDGHALCMNPYRMEDMLDDMKACYEQQEKWLQCERIKAMRVRCFDVLIQLIKKDRSIWQTQKNIKDEKRRRTRRKSTIRRVEAVGG